ncbi:dual specificity protein phosphatase 23 [Pelomyxa schiedti]|nr:dual specificity protein phosphatase 23 [Pelomyxa schiedti]
MVEPNNFSFVLPELAGMAYPTRPENFDWLLSQGVSNVVSLTSFNVPVPPGITHKFVDVPDMIAPTIAQIQEIIAFVDECMGKNQKVAIHCAAGLGRTGTLLACCLVHLLGLEGPEAIQMVRRSRPNSIETAEQEAVIKQYAAL